MGFNQQFCLVTTILLSTSLMLVFGSPLPQQNRRIPIDEIYQAYAPGQYTLDGGQEVVRVAGPRLVARPRSPVLRAIPASQLKRIRIANTNQQFIQPEETYAIDTPVTYAAQTLPVYHTSTQQQQQQQIQPTYYIQRNPQPHSAPVVVQQPRSKPVVRVTRPQAQTTILSNSNNNQNDEELEDEYPPDLNPQYNFSFDVKDDDLTNYQNRQEERDGNTVKGSYSVIDPDGYVRTVTYTADSKNGFQAKVTREPTDVKIKFPVPTESPEESPRPLVVGGKSVPSLRTQQFAQYPSTIAQYSPQQYQSQVQHQPQPSSSAGIYSQQSQLASGAYYTSGGAQPTYVVRRIPVGSSQSSSSSPRLIKVLRQ